MLEMRSDRRVATMPALRLDVRLEVGRLWMFGWIVSVERMFVDVFDDGVRREESNRLLLLDECSHGRR